MFRVKAFITVFAFVLGASPRAFAQSVFIPDVDLRAWFNTWVPVPVDGNGFLDTTNNNLTVEGDLVLTVDWSPNDLTGLQHITCIGFTVVYEDPGPTALTEYPRCEAFQVHGYPAPTMNPVPHAIQAISLFDCEQLLEPPTIAPGCLSLHMTGMDALASFPAIPAGLAGLSLFNLPILTELPDLTGLSSLRVDGCPVLQQPAYPPELISLVVTQQPWTILAPLPSGLEELYLENLPMTDLPAAWPTGLVSLYLSDLPATELPDFSNGLSEVRLFSLMADTIPSLSMVNGEIVMVHGGPALVHIAPMSFSGTQPVQLSFLNLPLVDSLRIHFESGIAGSLYCNDLPALIGVTELPGSNQAQEEDGGASFTSCPQLSCLPELPWSMTSLALLNTGVTCVPNHPGLAIQEGFTADFPPICNVATSMCLQLQPVVVGNTFNDLDQNGALDAEPVLPNATIACSPGAFIGSSDLLGAFAIGIDTTELQIQAVPGPYELVTTAPATVHANALAWLDTVPPIGLFLLPDIYDIQVDLIPAAAVPGFECSYAIVVQNPGNAQSGQVSLSYPPELTWVGASLVPTSQQPGTAVWDMPLMAHNEVWVVDVQLGIPVGTPLGSFLTFTAQAAPQNADNTPADNVLVLEQEVVSSVDPNDKSVTPQSVTSAEAMDGTELTYMIRFQNTGTWPAGRVVITDTLSADLQWNSVAIVATSHPATWYIQNGVLHFIFDPITLPDSLSDEPGSHGYVRFRMRTVPGLLNGTSVSNTANIYFDFNSPVVTEPAVFAVDDNTSVAVLGAAEASVYPNPAGNHLFIQRNNSALVRIAIMDGTGRILFTAQGTERVMQLDVSHLARGSYMLRISDGQMTRSSHFSKL